MKTLILHKDDFSKSDMHLSWEDFLTQIGCPLTTPMTYGEIDEDTGKKIFYDDPVLTVTFDVTNVKYSSGY